MNMVTGRQRTYYTDSKRPWRKVWRFLRLRAWLWIPISACVFAYASIIVFVLKSKGAL